MGEYPGREASRIKLALSSADADEYQWAIVWQLFPKVAYVAKELPKIKEIKELGLAENCREEATANISSWGNRNR